MHPGDDLIRRKGGERGRVKEEEEEDNENCADGVQQVYPNEAGHEGGGGGKTGIREIGLWQQWVTFVSWRGRPAAGEVANRHGAAGGGTTVAATHASGRRSRGSEGRRKNSRRCGRRYRRTCRTTGRKGRRSLVS